MKKIRKRIIASSLFILAAGLLSFNEEITGWYITGSDPGSYNIGTEVTADRGGKVAFLKSNEPKIKGFGSLMQNFRPTEFIGEKVKLTGFIKSKDLTDWAGMWMRIDVPNGPGKPMKCEGFDNMQNRPIKGTTEWTQYEIILDVPKECTNIAYGVLISKTGNLWIDDFKFEVIKKETIIIDSKEEPMNMSFEEK